MKSSRPFYPTPVIAIDGPTASGKGTVATLVAAHLGFHLLDSGALYRLAALASVRYAIAPEDAEGLAKLVDDLHITFREGLAQLDGVDVSGEIRQEAIGILASYVAPELEQSLMDTFGLASLTFQLPTGTSYGSVGVGRYFGDDIFVSIGQTFGGPQGGTSRQLGGLVGSSLTVQYYLTPNVTLQTSSSTEGESALDAVWHTRY